MPCGIAGRDNVTAGGSIPARIIASTIQRFLGEEVVDRTGLEGNFDFYIELPVRNTPDPVQNALDASIFTAVEEQLGMKLERQAVTRDVCIVERVSPPTPN